MNRTEIEALKHQFEQALSHGVQKGDLTIACKLKTELQSQIARAVETICPAPAAIFTLEIDHDQTIEDLIKIGPFDLYSWIDKNIKEAHFPNQDSSNQNVDLGLFNFDGYFSTADIVKKISFRNFRPARPHELLAFASQRPTNIPLEHFIIALGQTWCQPDDQELTAPALLRYGSGYRLSLARVSGSWSPNCYFAAVYNPNPTS